MPTLNTFKRSEFTNMKSCTLSKGNQSKYRTAEWFIKEDYLGYEGLSEVVASRLARELNIPCVRYEPCIITSEYAKRTGCCSKVHPNLEKEITLGKVLEQTSELTFEEIIADYKTTSAKIEAVGRIVSKVIPEDVYFKTLNRLFSLDAIILNEDRHIFNIGFYQGEFGIYELPVYDNGAAFASDLTMDYPIGMPWQACIKEIKAKPFTLSFHEQRMALNKKFGNPIEYKPYILIQTSDLYHYYDEQYINRVEKILDYQLRQESIIVEYI